LFDKINKKNSRRKRDSNPRPRFTQGTRFPGVRLRPLGHLSKIAAKITKKILNPLN
jgi:hypothetical protein